MNHNQSSAKIDNSVNLPDYFSCNSCKAKAYGGSDICDLFQQRGRCRAATLDAAIATGQIKIVMSLPAGER